MPLAVPLGLLSGEDLGLSPFGAGEPDHLLRFTEWLRERHGRSTIGWYDVIEQMDGSERNLRTFFREFAAYLEASGIDLDAIEPVLPRSSGYTGQRSL